MALWYPDHAMGITGLNVCAGLVGLYIIRDEQEMALNLSKDVYEILLVIQDERSMMMVLFFIRVSLTQQHPIYSYFNGK